MSTATALTAVTSVRRGLLDFKQDIAAEGKGDLDKLLAAYRRNFNIERAGDTVTGPRLVYRIGEGTGEMERPSFAIPNGRRAVGDGSLLPASGDEELGPKALHRLADLPGNGRFGKTQAAVGAAGGVGTFAVQIAKALGAEVTAVCSGRNVELVRSLWVDA